MKLIKPKYEILQSQGLFKDIEIAARTCYKSEGLICEGSDKKMVDMLIQRKHFAMLRHGTVYLQYNHNSLHPYIGSNLYEKYKQNKYSESHYDYINRDTKATIVTTNYNVLVENNWLDDLQYQCEPTKYHEKRISVRFTTQVAISREYNRHSVNSIAESSTRYCNYSKDKFGNEITINLPHCVTEIELDQAHKYTTEIAIPNDEYGTLYEKETKEWLAIDWWLWANACTELAYMKLIELGWKAQDARTILPLDVNTELIHTAFVSDWKHFFEMRDAETAHPDARALAHGLHEEFKRLNLL